MATGPQVGQINGALAQHSPEIGVENAPATTIAHWSLGLRISFRWCFAYFILFSLSNQIFGGLHIIPGLRIPQLGVLWPLRQITFWAARHIFDVKRELIFRGIGSGDKTFDWVQTFCLLVMAIMIAVVWSLMDRKRSNYCGLHKWFFLYVRFALASEMFLYGFNKVIPVQMSFPFLTTLVEPYGNFSPMASLWYSIGASRSYEIIAGVAEVVGGLLLVFPRTVTLGALVCLADLSQVLILNMSYDVPVKLMAFHLILFALFMVSPDLRRLVTFFFLDRPTAAPSSRPLFREYKANRLAVALQLILGMYLIYINVYGSIQAWYSYGDGEPRPALFGIWDVEQMSVDGQIRSPLLTDYDRWRRMIFDFTTQTTFQRMDDSFVTFGSSINERNRTIILVKADDKKWRTTLAYVRPVPGQLLLDGLMDNHQIHMQLKLFDRNKFNLVNRGFHWINEYPFQR